MSSKHWFTDSSTVISLDSGTLEKFALLCSFLGYKNGNPRVHSCMGVESTPPPPEKKKKRFVRACLDTILQAELWATSANPEAVWCDTLERNTVNTEEASDRDKQASALFHREPDADTERCSDNCAATKIHKKRKIMTAPKRRRLLLTK